MRSPFSHSYKSLMSQRLALTDFKSKQQSSDFLCCNLVIGAAVKVNLNSGPAVSSPTALLVFQPTLLLSADQLYYLVSNAHQANTLNAGEPAKLENKQGGRWVRGTNDLNQTSSPPVNIVSLISESQWGLLQCD